MKLRYLPLLFIATPAIAQQPAFVPFTVTEADRNQFQAVLNHYVPLDYAKPMVDWFNALEQQAQEEKLKQAASQPKPEKGDKK